MNYLDILMLIVVSVSIFSAIVKGLATELISVGGTLIGLLLAMFLCLSLSRLLAGLGLNAELSGFLSFVSVFVFCLISGILAGALLSKLLQFKFKSSRERYLSGLSGACRGLLVNIAVIMAFTTFPVNRELISESVLAPVFGTAAGVLVNLAPGEFRESFYRGLEQFR